MQGAATEDPKNFGFSPKKMNQNFFIAYIPGVRYGERRRKTRKNPEFLENGGPKRFFVAYIPGVTVAMRVEDANEGLTAAMAKNRIFSHKPWDEPPLIFVYRSGEGDARSGDVARQCGDFSEKADTLLNFLAIYPM